MTHYVCPACGNTSEQASACVTDGCNMVGRDMLECHCTDELHGEIMEKQAI
jgi:hypothetical protein